MSPQPIPSSPGFNPIEAAAYCSAAQPAVAAAGVLSACGSSSPRPSTRQTKPAL